MRGTVQINVPGKRLTGELFSLSLGGFFVLGTSKLKTGAEYRIYLLINGVKQPVQVTAKVLYNLPAMDGHEEGTGFAFTKLSEDAEPLIGEAVKRSGELFQRLLFVLTDGNTTDPDEVEQLCREAGLPEGLTTAELRWRVVQTVSQFRV